MATLTVASERRGAPQPTGAPGPLSTAWGLVKDAVNAWLDDYAPSMGAALAYYTMFSIAPLLLIVIAVAGLVFGEEAARGEIVAQLQGLMGDAAARRHRGPAAKRRQAGQRRARHADRRRAAADRCHHGVRRAAGCARPHLARARAHASTAAVWKLLRARLLSFGLILGIGFLLIVSLVFSAAMAALGSWWGRRSRAGKLLRRCSTSSSASRW